MAAESPSETPGKGEQKTTGATASSPITPKPSPGPHEEIKSVARNFSDHPLQNPEPGVWAVLTAISRNARQRPQGMNIILNGDEHCIGRLVEDVRFQIGDMAVSANHCKIFRRKVAPGDDGVSSDSCVMAFLKDTSTNGTFVNWKKLRKRSPETFLQHGDIISFLAAPHEESAYAFVYREVCKSICSVNGPTLKRKAEEFLSESKRTKGIGLGAAEGPVSLDDVRNLQRSNMELRKQLESHALTIESLNSENRASSVHHENELKEITESISCLFKDQIKEMQSTLDGKQKELEELIVKSVEYQNSIKDLNERLTMSEQSRTDSDEIMSSQKVRILELEAQLDEERNQRREERENAAVDLKSAVEKVKLEMQEEIKRQIDTYTRQNKEQEEKFTKLQESEKEKRALVDTLRSKLEDNREKLVISEKKVRQLEAQVQEEQLASESIRKKMETVESERKRLKKEVELEKVAREEAWAKVSALELEIASAMHELSIEKQRLQGARERVILRETQLRAFYSTTEEISELFAKQQEQLKAMQKTLEDEENCENTSMGIDLNANLNEVPSSVWKQRHAKNVPLSISKVTCINSKNARIETVTGSDDSASSTEKHECGIGSQDEETDTQNMECTSADKLLKAFGSDIDGVGTAPILDGEAVDTEQVLETESPLVDVCMGGKNIILHKCRNLVGETIQIDDEVQIQSDMDKPAGYTFTNDKHSQSNLEDTEADTVRTQDLLASELPGSWANSTAPSVHGENDYTHCINSIHDYNGDDGATCALFFPSGQAEAGQTNTVVPGVPRLTEEHLALNEMIGIVAPELKDQFQRELEKGESVSDSETEEGSNHSNSGLGEDENNDYVNEDDDDSVNEADDASIDDSIG